MNVFVLFFTLFFLSSSPLLSCSFYQNSSSNNSKQNSSQLNINLTQKMTKHNNTNPIFFKLKVCSGANSRIGKLNHSKDPHKNGRRWSERYFLRNFFYQALTFSHMQTKRDFCWQTVIKWIHTVWKSLQFQCTFL